MLRPHPALWRVVLSLGVVYQLFLVFLLFQVLEMSYVLLRVLVYVHG